MKGLAKRAENMRISFIGRVKSSIWINIQ